MHSLRLIDPKKPYPLIITIDDEQKEMLSRLPLIAFMDTDHLVVPVVPVDETNSLYEERTTYSKNAALQIGMLVDQVNYIPNVFQCY